MPWQNLWAKKSLFRNRCFPGKWIDFYEDCYLGNMNPSLLSGLRLTSYVSDHLGWSNENNSNNTVIW